jgi:hypothetical protein
MHLAHCNMHIAIESILRLTYGSENTTNLYVFKYEFNTTNLYMTNQKKNSNRKNLRIRMKQRLHTERKNSNLKKALPLEPRYAGIFKFTTKIFLTLTQKGGWYNFFI